MKRNVILHQLIYGVAFLLAVIAVGSVGYVALEDFNWLDAVYMTIITISTTGFAEVRPLDPAGRILTILLIVLGVSSLAYIGGRAAQLIIESIIFRRGNLNKRIEELDNHYIVCGYGRLGKFICEELFEAKIPFVIIEKDDTNIDLLSDRGYLFVHGDATSDEVLMSAGIKRAKGVVAVLATDAENVYVTLSAKVFNPRLFVVTRAVDEETETKLRRAGADRIVKPYEIGATRMVHLLLRPTVVDFIDIVSRKSGMDINLEEIVVCQNSPLIGKTLATSSIRQQLNIIIVAIYRKNEQFIYNPTSSTTILEEDRLIAIGHPDSLLKLNKLCSILQPAGDA